MSRKKLNFNLIYFIIYFAHIRTQALNPSLFISSYSTCVTGALAHNETECNSLNTIDNYCCYLSSLNQTGEGFCFPLAQSKFTGMKTVYYNQTSYSIYCGFGSTNAMFNNPGAAEDICFRINPKTYQECYLNSTATDSCCYYSYTGISGCYWSGTSYIGSTVVDGLTLICSVSYTEYSSVLLLFVFIFFILN